MDHWMWSKALIVLHTMIRNGATDNVLQYLASSGVLRLQNVGASQWEGFNAPTNLQHYAMYLDSRICAYRELKHDAICVQSKTNRELPKPLHSPPSSPFFNLAHMPDRLFSTRGTSCFSMDSTSCSELHWPYSKATRRSSSAATRFPWSTLRSKASRPGYLTRGPHTRSRTSPLPYCEGTQPKRLHLPPRARLRSLPSTPRVPILAPSLSIM
ncbi:hypothetical protein F5148DRAFT_256948 [Russula earlei]|uniref:Uncharacterized protein n=1 Tax=Russula earlei TaxID=71964 RepID=A0ACC0U3K5_9AGAM|nr:hypothetical protein F5148DRAFT_256948 [Russula earlei]